MLKKLVSIVLVVMLAVSVYLSNEVVSKSASRTFDFGSDAGLLFLAAILVGLMSVLYFGREVYNAFQKSMK